MEECTHASVLPFPGPARGNALPSVGAKDLRGSSRVERGSLVGSPKIGRASVDLLVARSKTRTSGLDHPPPGDKQGRKRHAQAAANDEPQIKRKLILGEQVAQDEEERECAERVAWQSHEGDVGVGGKDRQQRD